METTKNPVTNNELPKGLYRRKDSPFIWGKFKLRYMDKPYCFSTETNDARAAKKQYEVKRGEALAGKLEKKPSRISLKDLILNRYLPLCKRQRNYLGKLSYARELLKAPMFADKSANQVTKEDCKIYKLWAVDYSKESTVNRRLAFLKHVYNVAINELGLKLINPVTKMKFYSEQKFKRHRFMTEEEKTKILMDPKFSMEAKNIFMLAIKTGMRQGEIRDLQWEDVDFNNNVIRVKAGEEDRPRFIPIFREVREILTELPRISKWVFCYKDGSQLSRQGYITTAFRYACKRNNIPDLRFHDLRHTFASDFVMGGGNFKTLASYMGHATSTMTDRYAHLSPEFRNEQINILPSEAAFKTFKMAQNGQKNGYVFVTQRKEDLSPILELHRNT